MRDRPTRVLVTGAAGAFGSATAVALRGRGVRVAGLDQSAAEGVLRCDVTDPAQVDSAVPAALDQLGGVDALVHFAGVGLPVDAGAAPADAVRQTLEVNLLGAWRVTAAAVEALVSSRGRVVFVASELAYATLPFASAYAVSKRGLTAYADTLRMEYRPHLAVSTVYPGYVRTAIHEPSIAAGLGLEGQVRRETVADVVETVLRVLAAPRPPRDTAVTRAGNVELWLARHIPRLVDAAVETRLRRDVRRGRYDTSPVARGVVDRRRGGRLRR